jgi:hypothetical protein
MSSSNLVAPLTLTLYGVDDEVKRQVSRSIIPWGVLELAIDLQEEFENVAFNEAGDPQNITRDQVARLTDFIVFIFDNAVTADEVKSGASLADMFALYRQIFSRVSEIMQKNPTQALASQKQNLQKVRQGKRH